MPCHQTRRLASHVRFEGRPPLLTPEVRQKRSARKVKEGARKVDEGARKVAAGARKVAEGGGRPRARVKLV